MEIDDFRAELNNSVQALAATGGRFSEEAFIAEVGARLSEAEEIDNLIPCHHNSVGVRGRHLRVDGFDLGDEEGHLVVAISDFHLSETTTLGTEAAKKLFAQAKSWVESALSGALLSDLEESSAAYQFAWDIHNRRDSLFKVRIYLLSNNKLSARLRELPSESVDSISYEYHPWDIERFLRVTQSALGREEIDIDLTEWAPSGVPILRAPTTSADVETYLAIVPGSLLSSIYRRYGSRVLESNVRSFLSNRGKVNKGIRGTMMQEPELFLTYNNGITATAGEVTVTRDGGSLSLRAIRDLQIVNGGQTTASIFYVEKDEKNIDLSKVFVQMKLTVVDEDIESDLVPRISRYANSQNAVSEADFFSNHAFHRRMEEKSRRILAPAKAGVRFQSKWFYERARGQYLSERAKFSASGSKKFEAEYPRSQVLTKVDAAKFFNSWAMKPHTVSHGAQKNFLEFAKVIDAMWQSDDSQFGDDFFRSLIAKSILFNTLRTKIMKAEWYGSGYLANIVTYTMAKLADIASTESRGGDLDFARIWNEQRIEDDLLDYSMSIAEGVFGVLTDDSRDVVNVTEWAKREKCWTRVRELRVPVIDEIAPHFISGRSVVQAKQEQKLDQKLLSGIEAQIYVQNLGQPYWYKLREFARLQKMASEKELGILRYATGEAGRVPSEAQSQVLIALESRTRDAGFAGK